MRCSRLFLSVLAVTTIASAGLANAAFSVEGERRNWQRNDLRTETRGFQLAQNGEVDVFYDRYGREVLVDRETGEVIAVEPRRLTRQEWRRQQRQRELGRLYDEEPIYEDGVVREPPRLLRERGRRYEYEDRATSPDYDFGDENLGEFPAAPDEDGWTPGEDQRRVLIEPRIERAPLDEPKPRQSRPRQTDTAVANPSDGTSTGSTGPTKQVPAIDAGEPGPSFASRPEVAALQVLLDRKGASPGVIDGRFGSNVDKALAAYRELTGDNLKSTDTEGIKQRLAESGGDPFADYVISSEDVAGSFVASIPEDYGEKAKLERLSYTSVTEMLAERFHMDENYLKALNPDANFNRPGTIIKVANFGKLVTTPVARIVADKAGKQVRAYDESGRMVAAYPATIGSSDTPSPSGTHAVSRIALDPNYTYNPNINFKQGNNTGVLTIPPGPNGPVGSVWIALDKPTYGIHGTPEPSKIGKTESHGCVRLTNWDARELAKLVKPGVNVEFID
ncbi:MAG: murein L,D-transpeptidase [Rhizobiaceae bacterium]|nr:murein L,D-transpeptidase [Rhizobiaceae bacterium]